MKLALAMVENYREISRLWHQFIYSSKQLQIEEVSTKRKRGSTGSIDSIGKGAKRLRYKVEAIEEAGERAGEGAVEEAAVSELAIDNRLQRLLGNSTIWQSEEQCKGMVKVIRIGDRVVLIIVLPIGGSKSILFMAPAVMEDSSMSIMVVLFIALIDDLVAWAKALEINCI